MLASVAAAVATVADVLASVAVITLDAPEWALGAANGGAAVAIGMAVIGTVAIAMAVIGTAAIAMQITGTATTGTATIGVATTGMDTTGMAIMSSLSVTSAFHGGGVGVRHGAGAIRTDMDIMVLVMVIRTATVTEATDTATPATVTDTATPDTVMDPATAIDPDTAIAATPEWLSYSAGWLAPVTIMDPSMASSGRRRDERFGLTNRNTRTRRLIHSLLVTAIS